MDLFFVRWFFVQQKSWALILFFIREIAQFKNKNLNVSITDINLLSIQFFYVLELLLDPLLIEKCR